MIKPPKVLEAPNPTSSKRIQTIFGAPFGAVTGSGQYSLESAKVLPIVPLNSCLSCANPNCAIRTAVIKSPFLEPLIEMLFLKFFIVL